MTPLSKLLRNSASGICYGALVWTFSASVPSGDGSMAIAAVSDAEKSATLALVAPTVMWFEAIPSGIGADPITTLPALTLPYTNTTDLIYDAAFCEAFYFWKLTTHPAGYRTTYAPDEDYNMPTAWNDRRIAYGQKVTFCFDEPGAYTLECFAVGPTGLTAVAATSFTIADPDTAYPGAATLCVNPAGDTNFLWAPDEANNLKFSTGADDRAVVDAMLTSYRSGTTSRRILFKPGATFNMRGASLGNWNNSGDTRLRHYIGSPLGETPATLELGNSGNGPKINDNSDHASFTLCNLKFVGPYSTQAQTPVSTADGFAINSEAVWRAMPNASVSTHYNIHKVHLSQFGGVTLATPFFLGGFLTNNRGVMARTGFSEVHAEHGNRLFTLFMNHPRDASDHPLALDDPPPKVAFVGCKIASPLDAMEYPTNGYETGGTPTLIRGTYHEMYFGACDFYYNDTAQPILRLHDGAIIDASRYLWCYINIDRMVTEGGSNSLEIMTHPPGGYLSSTGSSPANCVIDKFLHISHPGAPTFGGVNIFGGSGNRPWTAGSFRNIVAVVPAATPTNGSAVITLSGSNGGLGANNAHDLAHPRRFHNMTVVVLGNNSQISTVKPWFSAGSESVFDDFTFDNNVLHYPNQTLNETTAFKQTNLTGALLPGVTPRYPGRNDAQAMWTPPSLTGASIANGATFDVLFSDLNARNTASTNRAYTAASQTYWTNNPTHNFHYIRQSGTYHYVYTGGLSVSVLSDRLQFTNNTGGTLSGNWEIWIDRRGLHPGPQASSATPTDMPLSWSPGSGSSAFPASGLQAFDTFLRTVRVGNTIPTGSGLTQATGADPQGAFGQA